MTDHPFPIEEDGAVVDATADFTFSQPALDAIWLDLQGDLPTDLAMSVTEVTGPFAVDTSGYDDPFAFPAGDDGAATSLLSPWDAAPGFVDPWALPADGADWTSFQSFDPMATASDWTVDGGWSVPGVGAEGFDGGSFDSTWLSEPGSYYDSSSYWDSSGYWDTSSYYEASSDSFDTTSADGGVFDASAVYETPAYDTSYDSSYDATSSDGYVDTWSTPDTEWVTPAWDIEGASAESNMWMDTYDELTHGAGGEWDLWNASVEASLNGDDMLAYELNQASVAAGSAADQAWTYSGEAWSDPAYFPDPYEVPVDSGYDTTTYDTTSYDTTSYDTTTYDTSSYDTTTEW
jgi:hypothetical protein